MMDNILTFLKCTDKKTSYWYLLSKIVCWLFINVIFLTVFLQYSFIIEFHNTCRWVVLKGLILFKCCVFWPPNESSTHHSLVEIIFYSAKTNFSDFFRHKLLYSLNWLITVSSFPFLFVLLFVHVLRHYMHVFLVTFALSFLFSFFFVH